RAGDAVPRQPSDSPDLERPPRRIVMIASFDSSWCLATHSPLNGVLLAIRFSQRILLVCREVTLDLIAPSDRPRQKIHSLINSLIGFRATEPQEPSTGLAETLTAQTRNAKLVVSSFKEIECQPMRSDSQAVAHRSNVGEHVERAGRPSDLEALDAPQPFA